MSDVPPSTPAQRRLGLVFLAVVLLLGGLAIKRAVNGNADLSGNYRHWRTNLTKSTLPVRREGPVPEDPDSYPPITYAIYSPLGALPLWATAALWYGLNVGCSIYLWRSARTWLYAEMQTVPEAAVTLLGWHIPLGPEVILALAVAAILPSWIGSLLLGQNTLLVMSLTWGAFQSVRRNRPWLAGCLLLFATAIKVLPVVFLLPSIFRLNYRVCLAFAVSGVLLVAGFGSLYFGPRTNLEFHLTWLKFATQGPENRPADPHDPNTLRGSLRYHNQSIETVLARLLMDVPIHNRPGAPHVNLANISAPTWRRVSAVATGMCVLLGLYVLIRRVGIRVPFSPTSEAEPEATSVETYALLSLLQLFVSPVVWSHYYLWLFWPLLIMLVAARRGRTSGYVVYVTWIAMLPLIGIPQVRAVGLHLWVTLAIYIWTCWYLLATQRRRDPVALPG